jgi:hypothetical protein
VSWRKKPWPTCLQWVADNLHKVEARKSRRKRTGTAHLVRESDFVSSGARKARLGISHYALTKLTSEGGFPTPVLTVGDDRVWLLSQVEAYSRNAAHGRDE